MAKSIFELDRERKEQEKLVLARQNMGRNLENQFIPRPAQFSSKVAENSDAFGGAREGDIFDNAALDIQEMGQGYMQLGKLLFDDPVNTLKEVGENMIPSMIDSYKRWYDAFQEGTFLDRAHQYPVQFAQDMSSLISLGAGSVGAVAKIAGRSRGAAQAAQAMDHIVKWSDRAQFASDPFTAPAYIVGRKAVGKIFVPTATTAVDRVNQWRTDRAASKDPIADMDIKDPSDTAEMEFQANTLPEGKTMWDNVVDFPKKVTENFFRKYTRLDHNNPTDGKIAEVLNQYERSPNSVTFETAYEIRDIIHDLSPKQMELFEKMTVAKDAKENLLAAKSIDGEIPLWGTQENLDAAIHKYGQLIAMPGNEKLIEAFSRREHLMDSFKQELFDADLIDIHAKDNNDYFHRQVLDYMEMDKRFSPGSTKAVKTQKAGFQMGRTINSKAYSREYATAEMEWVAQGKFQLEQRKTLNNIKSVADQSSLVKGVAKDWDVTENAALDFINKGRLEDGLEPLDKWTPDKMPAYRPVFSIKDDVAEMVMTNGQALVGSEEIKEAGGFQFRKHKDEMYLPRNIAETIDDMIPPQDNSFFARTAGTITKTWKKWILTNPFRVLRYNLNNLSGDADIAMAYNPKIFAHMKEAAVEATTLTRGKYDELTDRPGITPTDAKVVPQDVREAIRLGVIDSGFSGQEVKGLTDDDFFKVIMGKNPSMVKRLWRSGQNFTNWRENLIRLATYKHFKKELAENPNKKFFAASKQMDIEAMYADPTFDNNDIAARLSRDLIGDYGNISAGGQWLRRHMIPFYSWMEVNMPRYVRLAKNITAEGSENIAGRLAAVAGKKLSIGTAKNGLKFGAGAAGLYTAMQLWNNTQHPELEEQLGSYARREPHLIIGQNADGSIKTVRFQGAFADFISWLDLQDLPEDIRQISKGERSVGDVVGDSLAAPFEKLVLSTNPLMKTGIEAMMGRGLYPKPFGGGRPIRDTALHIARTAGVDKLYRRISGAPNKPISEDLAELLMYRTDPGEAAYWEMKSQVHDFLRENGSEPPAMAPTKKANALYFDGLTDIDNWGEPQVGWFNPCYRSMGHCKGCRRS